MNNFRLLKYELKRLIFTKKYFYLILILGMFTYDILMRLVIDGFYGTAPFSQWSYTFFVTAISPFLSILLVLLYTTVFDEKELRVRKIIYSLPVPQFKYYIIKFSAITISYIAAALLPIAMSFIYYSVIFDYRVFGSFVKPIILFLIPAFVFVSGLCMILGKINVKLLYGLIPILFLVQFNFKIPVWIDIFGNNFLNNDGWAKIITCKQEIVPYSIPNDFINSRLLFVILGITLFIFACRKSEAE